MQTLTARLKQTLQTAPQQLLPQLPLQLTTMLPEPKLISQPLPPLTHTPTHVPRPHQRLDPTQTAAPVSPWCTPETIYVSRPSSWPVQSSLPHSQLNPMGTLPLFSPQFYPPHHSRPLPFPAPASTQGTRITVPSLSPVMYSPSRFQATPSPRPLSQPPPCSVPRVQ